MEHEGQKEISKSVGIDFNDKKAVLEIIQKRYKKAKGIADMWQSVLEACYHFAVPFRNRFYKPKPFQGDLDNTRIFDTTSVEATHTFVSRIQEAMTPPQTQWGYLEVNNENGIFEDEDDLTEAQRILDSYTRRVFRYIHASNFDVVVNECYYDLAVGSAGLVINQGDDDCPLRFTSIPIDTMSIEEAADGKIRSWYRTWDDLKISELNDRWRGIKISREMAQQVQHDPDATVKKIYEGAVYFPTKEGKKYLYAVWTQECFLLSEWKERNPGVVWRFQKTNNEVWGRGPVMNALPTIISCNEMARLELAAANLNVFKPYMGWTDGIFNPNTFMLKPFSVIPISPMSQGMLAPLQPLAGATDLQFSQLTIQDLRMQIKTMMFAQEATDTVGIQPQSVYELSLVQNNLAQKIGPLFARQLTEFLEPVFENCCNLLAKTGHLPRPELNGAKITFKYRSPLALSQAQKDVEVIGQFVQLVNAIYGPELARLYLNTGKGPFLLAEMLQVNPMLLNSPAEVEQAAQQVAQQMAAQQMMGGQSEADINQ